MAVERSLTLTPTADKDELMQRLERTSEARRLLGSPGTTYPFMGRQTLALR